MTSTQMTLLTWESVILSRSEESAILGHLSF